jgi:Ca2+-binding RTX toxin-like protein
MTRRIGLATTIALGLLTLAPAASQAVSQVSVSLTGGNTLQVVGGDGADGIDVNHETDSKCPGGSPCYLLNDSLAGSALSASAPCVVTGTPGTSDERALCPASGVTGLAMFGHGGDDILTVGKSARALRADIHGGAGGDGIIGGSKADTLYGGSGRDQIFGARGNDTIVGGPGSDRTLIGSAGDDLLKGQAGNDGMNGGPGHDRCIGGPGRDIPRHCERVKSVP